jgi:pyruvate,orthophosphate dikinase
MSSIYFFGGKKADGNSSMKDILGGKGANLAEMSNIGIPVPFGFTISTEECIKYYKNKSQLSEELKKDILNAVKRIESDTGMGFGSSENPLLVSVRSGSKFSMPGMMDTILNLGLNDITVEALAKRTSNKRFALDSYRRFIQMYSDVVLGIEKDEFERIMDDVKTESRASSDADVPAEKLEKVIKIYKEIVLKHTSSEFEQDVNKQLMMATEAVFKSWMNQRAITYRKHNDISDDIGTAVNIQSMVFGNMGSTSATGVAFTRNPSTGENEIYGEYLINAQGEDVVAGIRTPLSIVKDGSGESLAEKMPDIYNQLVSIFAILEKHYLDMQDVEFTIQDSKLWILQTRNGKRSANAAIKVAVDMVNEGLISKEDAILRIEPKSLDSLLHPSIDRSKNPICIARGLPASPGAATGEVVFSSKDAEDAFHIGKHVILVRDETSPEDIGGMYAAVGILTARGGMTSHAAVVARGMGKTCVSGCTAVEISRDHTYFRIGRNTFVAGDIITIDGSTGEIFAGQIETKPSERSKEFETFMSWVDGIKKTKVRVNAETEIDCKSGLAFGAEGIGLCRTEHMFFEKDRIISVRKMIMSDDQDMRKSAISEILDMQKSDFMKIFEIMNDLPVNIRLLDPPLHEFLPNTEDEKNILANAMNVDVAVIEKKASSLHEVNPMLGHRGSRLGITHPEIFEMQAKAIFMAVKESRAKGIIVIPEIMLPIIMNENELSCLIDLVISIAESIGIERSSYQIGTMIELPRACMIADKIANHAEYFSFGTNDLTQTTLGLSRDDSAGFIMKYIDKKILFSDPFAQVDEEGVGEMIKIAIAKGRARKNNIKLGVCGEHGGDPKSIDFFVRCGLDYVSCSPYRIPIAKLAVARSEILMSIKK